MAYRDELQAANARIRALEEEVEALRAEMSREGAEADKSAALWVRERLVKLSVAERRIAELESRSDESEALELKRRLASSEANLARLQKELAAAGMRTVVEHNRLASPEIAGDRAGVLCPLCLLSGHEVEMRVGITPDAWVAVTEGVRAAACPACLHLHALRVAARSSEP